jgi:outer membrane protein TolC
MSNLFVRKLRHFALVSGVALLASCASYRPLELKPAAAQQDFEMRTLSDPRVTNRVEALLPPDQKKFRWGTAELLIAANEFNPALAEAKTHLTETTAALTTAHAIANPTVSLGSEYDLKQAAEPSWLYSVSTSVLLDSILARKVRVRLAQASVRAARLDYAESIWSVRRDLRASLVSMLIAERRVALLKNVAEANGQLVRMISDRVREGEASPAERLQAQLELIRARTALTDAHQKLRDASAKLAASIGVPIEALAGQPFALAELDHPEGIDESGIDTLRASAALARTDLERAIVDYDTRELELKEQVRAQYPQVSLGPGYTWDHGIPKATFGIGFTVPMFNHNQGPIAEAIARRASAAQHVITVQQQALNEIDAARNTYREQSKALELARAQSRAARDAVEQLERAVTLGAEDRPTLLAARISAAADALAELDALERTHAALGQLEDALRTPLNDTEAKLQSFSTAGAR